MENTDIKPQGGYFYIIPAKLVEEGNPTKALLFGLIASLANTEGYCWASTQYLAEKLGRKHRGTIQNYLNELEKDGWIKRVVDKKKGNERKIFVNFTNSHQLEKTNNLVRKNVQGCTKKRTRLYEKTYISNIKEYNNNSKYRKKEKNKKENENKEKLKKEATEIIDTYNKENKTRYRAIDPLIANLEYWRKIYSLEEIKIAIKNIKKDSYWKNKMSPTVLLRRKNPRGEGVDWIGYFLNLKGPRNNNKQKDDINIKERLEKLYPTYTGQKTSDRLVMSKEGVEKLKQKMQEIIEKKNINNIINRQKQ